MAVEVTELVSARESILDLMSQLQAAESSEEVARIRRELHLNVDRFKRARADLEIELRGSDPVQQAREAAQRARDVVTDPEHPVGKAIRDGVAAAKRKREEMEAVRRRQATGEEATLEEESAEESQEPPPPH